MNERATGASQITDYLKFANWVCGFKDNESEVLLQTDEGIQFTFTFQAIKPIRSDHFFSF